MIPPIYTLLAASSAVADVFGTPIRVWPWAEAREGADLPYATWTVIAGTPENYLGQMPDIDSIRVQVDVWAGTGTDCTAAATVLRDELEPRAHMVQFGNMIRDPETRVYPEGQRPPGAVWHRIACPFLPDCSR